MRPISRLPNPLIELIALQIPRKPPSARLLSASAVSRLGAHTAHRALLLDSLPRQRQKKLSLPYPLFLAHKLADKLGSGEEGGVGWPFARPRRPLLNSDRRAGAASGHSKDTNDALKSLESIDKDLIPPLKAALQVGDDSTAVALLQRVLASPEQLLDRVSDEALLLLPAAIKRSNLNERVKIDLASAVFFELFNVRDLTVPPAVLDAGMEVFARRSPAMALACLAALRRQGGQFTPRWASLACTALLSAVPPDAATASRVLAYTLDRVGSGNTQTVSRHVLAEMIAASDAKAALQWHAQALAHFGFPPDPVSTPRAPLVLPAKYNASRGLFDSRLSRVLANAGDVSACRALLSRYSHLTPPAPNLPHLRGSIVISHLKSDNPAQATELYRTWYPSVDPDALISIINHLASTNRTSDALALFTAYADPQLPPKHLASLYAAAIRISHPDPRPISRLIGELRRLRVPVPRESRILFASSLLHSQKPLEPLLNSHRAPRTLLLDLFRALCLGRNILALPRIWPLLLRARSADPVFGTPEESAELVRRCLFPEAEEDYLQLLSGEFAEVALEDGKMGKEWTEVVEGVREEFVAADGRVEEA